MRNYYWWGLFLAASAGIACSHWHLMGLAAAALLGMLAIAWPSQYRFALCIILGGFLAGMISYQLLAPPVAPDLSADGREITVVGKVRTYPVIGDGKSSFVLGVECDDPQLRHLHVFCSFSRMLCKGEQLRLTGELKLPSRPGNPGEFDYAGYLLHQDIYYILQVSDENQVQVTGASTGLNRLSNFYRERMQTLCERFLAAREAEVVLAMLLGDKSSLDQDRYRDFQQTGLVHVFAVSGLHVGFVIVFCTALAGLLNFSRRGRFCFTVFMILFYGQIVGWPVSVQRAVIMASLGLLAHYAGRVSKAVNCLGIAGLCIIIPSPTELFGAGFQLSFLATWGLVGIFPVLRKKLAVQHRLLDLLLVPVCAQLAVSPVIAYHYNLFTPASLIGNILVTYLAGGIVIMGFLALVLAVFISWLGSIFLIPAGILTQILLQVVDCCRSLPLSYLYVATPSAGCVLLYYTGLLLAMASISFKFRRRHTVGAVGLMIVALVLLLIPGGWHHRGEVEVVILDVGQGDSILIKSPQGKFILVDGGGSELTEVGQRKVLPYLYHRGIRELYLAVSTHPDTDHLRGMEEVLEEIPARYAVLPGTLADSPDYYSFRELVSAGRGKLLPVEAGDTVTVEKDFCLRVLGPVEDSGGLGSSNNDQSVVFSLQYGKFSALFTGDAGTSELQAVMDQEKPGTFTVVKVPHHGSRNSLPDGIYVKLEPALAVISAGQDNRFGHPHPEVLKALEDSHTRVFRTDRDGAVFLRSDGKRLQVHTYHGQI